MSVAIAATAVVACGEGGRSASPTTSTTLSSTATTSTTVSPAEIAGNNLVSSIIQAPEGFTADSTVGATGAVTPATFSEYAGSISAARAGFVAGYKQNYVDEANPDGVAITLFKFASDSDATKYFEDTESKTLSFAASTISPFTVIPNAVSVVGTKQYGSEWAHGVVFAKGNFYVSVFWLDVNKGPAPLELATWSKDQWLMLH